MVSSILILLFLLLLLLTFIIILISFIWTTIIGGVPYLATDRKRVMHMIELAKIKKGEKVVDLGSGDGRIVIAMAQKGAKAHGYELNLLYIVISKWNIRKHHLENIAHIHWQNFFTTDLSSFDVITCFGIPYVMDRIEKKLYKEVRPKSRIVINSFPFKKWRYTQRNDHIFLYTKSK